MKSFQEFLNERRFKPSELKVGAEMEGGIYIGNYKGDDLVIDNTYYSLLWEDAEYFCRKLNKGGYSDWYLPNIEEALFLYSQDKEHLFKLPDKHGIYWVNYEISDDTASAIDFNNGEIYTEDKLYESAFIPFRKI